MRLPSGIQRAVLPGTQKKKKNFLHRQDDSVCYVEFLLMTLNWESAQVSNKIRTENVRVTKVTNGPPSLWKLLHPRSG